jgi:hypothetical protein
MKLFDVLKGEDKEIQLSKEEESFLTEISDKYNVYYNDGYIEVYESEDIDFTADIITKLEKLGYKDAFNMICGAAYYYRYVDE